MTVKNEGIHDLDKRIIELLSQRAELSMRLIREQGYGYDAKEDLRIKEVVRECNRGPLPDKAVEMMLTELRYAAASAAVPVRVAYLGPEGTFSWIALREHFGSAVDPVPARTIPEVFRSVEKEDALFGIVPVENSTEGAVTFTLDELMETDLSIIGERYVRISYSIISRGETLGAIKKVYSHPQPLGQCKGWLRTNLAGAQLVDVNSTTQAAELAAADPEAAALGSRVAAEIYGMNVLAESVEDLRQNYTRFFVIGRGASGATGKDKTSIVCAVKDQAGALLKLLQPLSSAGINMSKIESRPDKKKMWEYNFFIDLQGHRDDTSIAGAMVKMREESIFLKILGSYPTGN